MSLFQNRCGLTTAGVKFSYARRLSIGLLSQPKLVWYPFGDCFSTHGEAGGVIGNQDESITVKSGAVGRASWIPRFKSGIWTCFPIGLGNKIRFSGKYLDLVEELRS